MLVVVDAVIKQFCAVVTRKDDQGRLAESTLVQVVQQPPDFVVDIRRLRVVLVAAGRIVPGGSALRKTPIDLKSFVADEKGGGAPAGGAGR